MKTVDEGIDGGGSSDFEDGDRWERYLDMELR